MDFASVEDIARHDFCGFVRVADLQASGCQEIPAEPGVYLVLRLSKSFPEFLVRSIGGHFKGKDPTLPVTELMAKWVDGPVVVYIGKAGKSGSDVTLRSRLRPYMDFGRGQPVSHRGGRAIWQLVDSADLVVCWKPTPGEEPAAVEFRLIQEFRAKYGKLPFANRRI